MGKARSEREAPATHSHTLERSILQQYLFATDSSTACSLDTLSTHTHSVVFCVSFLFLAVADGGRTFLSSMCWPQLFCKSYFRFLCTAQHSPLPVHGGFPARSLGRSNPPPLTESMLFLLRYAAT